MQRVRFLLLFLALFSTAVPAQTPLATEVAAIGVTVSDTDRSVEFFIEALTFEKVSDVEVAGESSNTCKAYSDCGCASRAGGRRHKTQR